MKKTVRGFSVIAIVVIVITTTVLLGNLISANRNQPNLITITQSPFPSPSASETQISSATLTPETPLHQVNTGTNQNIILVTAIVISIIGVLLLIRLSQATSRGFASLSENLKKSEEKQTANFQISRLLQQDSKEIIKGISLIRDANSQALNENISALRDEISEDIKRLEEIQSNTLQVGRLLQQGNKEIINGLTAVVQGKIESTQSKIVDTGDKTLNDNISILRDEISVLKNLALVNQAYQSKTVDVSDQALNDNILSLRDEISELKSQSLVAQKPVLSDSFIQQLTEIIRKLFKEHFRTDVVPLTPLDVLKSKVTVGIYERDLDKMKELVLEYPNLETGGDLFGFWTHSGAPVIQFVLGPGQKSTHLVTSFYQDEEFLKVNGEFLNQRHGLQHIGEWHSHHQMSLNHPSGGDEGTIYSALSNYGFQRFLLCIANIDRNGDVSIQPYLFEAENSTYKAGKWNIFSGESPFRSLELEMPGTGIDNIKNYPNTRVSSIESIQVKSILPQAWYTRKEGSIFLRSLDALLKETFDECEMKIKKTGRLYFSLKGNKSRAQLHFPDDFPKSEPYILVGEETYAISLKSGIKPDKLSRLVYDQFVKIVKEVEL